MTTHFINIIALTIAIALFCNCNGSHDNGKVSGEVVERITTFWDIDNNPTSKVTWPEKVWYQDSIGITQICRIWFDQTEHGQSTRIESIGYRFVNLKKKWAYEYASFTDTASVQQKYRYVDTTPFLGGWNFANRDRIAVDTLHVLSDTIINTVRYKRCRVNFNFNQAKFEALGLLRCDKENTHFQISTTISTKMGCPLVSFSLYPINSPQSKIDTEIKFVSNTIPDSVIKVFTAWKKNEISYPVE